MELKTGIEKLDYYCEGVFNKEIDACRWVRLAVERHYRDLDRQKSTDFPFYFEPKATMHYVNFFEENLFHFDGVYSGKPIIFEPWQYFCWGSPFGWLKTERVADMAIRRFREIIIIIPKKQGKTIIIAGTALYMIEWDNWPGAQIYFLALDQSQAKKLGYGDAVKLVNKNPELLQRYRVNKSAGDMGIYFDPMDCSIRPSISDPDKTDGLKVHMSANDEVKDWTDMGVYQTMKQNTASNNNALIANTTTAGSDMTSLGYELETKLKKILTGAIIDEQTFGAIYTIDEGDQDIIEAALHKKNAFSEILPFIKKANPNYGVSVGEDYYRGRIADAQKSPRDKNEFLTKHLNVWIHAMDHYFNMDEWRSLENPEYKDWQSVFAGKPCHVFIDLQNKKDIAPMYCLFRNGVRPAIVTHLCPDEFDYMDATVKKSELTQDQINRLAKDKGLIEKQWFVPPKKKYAVFGVNFLPRYIVSQNLIGKRGEYTTWADQGHFYLTEGKTTDWNVVYGVLKHWKKIFNIQSVGTDNWGPGKVASDIEALGLHSVIVNQTARMLSDPMKTLDGLITENLITHNGDPVLFWAMSNVVAKEDANENVFPRKETKDAKIDPAVALINLFAIEDEIALPDTGKRRVPKVW